jgi:MFS family permease
MGQRYHYAWILSLWARALWGLDLSRPTVNLLQFDFYSVSGQIDWYKNERPADGSGITYGALYGVSMAAVLAAVPHHARGTVAGFTQQGFGAGNLIASGLHLGMSKLVLSILDNLTCV